MSKSGAHGVQGLLRQDSGAHAQLMNKTIGNHLQQDYFSGGTSHDLDYSELNENVASVDFKLMAPVEILHCGADCKGKQETRIDA